MFSPTRGDQMRSARRRRLRPVPGIGRRLQRLDIVAGVERELGDGAHESLEQLVAGDEIGLGIDLDDGAGVAARSRRRPALRRRRGRPSWPPRRGPSCAASRPRPRYRPRSRSSARLQSIMPAPVFSRSSLTSAAVISAIDSSSHAFRRRCAARVGRRLAFGQLGGLPPAPRSDRLLAPARADIDAGGGQLGLQAVEHRARRPARNTDGSRASRRRCPGSDRRCRRATELLSSIATTGILSLFASWTAIASLLVSITNRMSGRPPISLMPPSARSSLSRSRVSSSSSRLVRPASAARRRARRARAAA